VIGEQLSIRHFWTYTISQCDSVGRPRHIISMIDPRECRGLHPGTAYEAMKSPGVIEVCGRFSAKFRVPIYSQEWKTTQ